MATSIHSLPFLSFKRRAVLQHNKKEAPRRNAACEEEEEAKEEASWINSLFFRHRASKEEEGERGQGRTFSKREFRQTLERKQL